MSVASAAVEVAGVPASGAPRLLVSRLYARAVGRSRRCAATLVRRNWLDSPRSSSAGRPAAAAATKPRELPVACGKEGGNAEADSLALVAAPPASRVLAQQACGRLLFRVCVFLAGLRAQATAQMLLHEMYRRVSRPRLDEHLELVVPVFQYCSIEEIARSTSCCRKMRSMGMLGPRMLEFWLKEHTPEARKDAMFLAIQRNAVGLLRRLVKAGTNVNCVFEQFWFRTPLHRAVSRASRELCEQLVALRGDCAQRDSHGAAPIHLAASKGRLPILDMLLEYEPRSVRAEDNSGRTACHMAALKGHLAAVRRLLMARASATAEAHDGCTPLDMARRGRHQSVVGYLDGWAHREAYEREALPAARFLLSRLLAQSVREENRVEPDHPSAVPANA